MNRGLRINHELCTAIEKKIRLIVINTFLEKVVVRVIGVLFFTRVS
jgi:hypothetical protein